MLPDGWRTRLNDMIEAVRAKPYDADYFHCAFFAADAIQAMTGVDPAFEFRGMTRLAAERHLKKYGGLLGFARSRFEEVHPSRASVGDIAVLKGDDEQPALGVVIGANILVSGEAGLNVVSLMEAETAFRV